MIPCLIQWQVLCYIWYIFRKWQSHFKDHYIISHRICTHFLLDLFALIMLSFLWNTWWRHLMETSPVNSPHKGQRREALMISLMGAWINVWVNNGKAGDLICNRTHHDVTVINLASLGVPPWVASVELDKYTIAQISVNLSWMISVKSSIKTH